MPSITNFDCLTCKNTGIETRVCTFSILRLPCDLCSAFDRRIASNQEAMSNIYFEPEEMKDLKSTEFLDSCCRCLADKDETQHQLNLEEDTEAEKENVYSKKDQRVSFLPSLIDERFIDYSFGSRTRQLSKMNAVLLTSFRSCDIRGNIERDRFEFYVNVARESALNTDIFARIVKHKYFSTISNLTLTQLRRKLCDFDQLRKNFSIRKMKVARRWMLLLLKSLDAKCYWPISNRERNILTNIVGKKRDAPTPYITETKNSVSIRGINQVNPESTITDITIPRNPNYTLLEMLLL